ncbi:hypothetical protein, partial [Ralstonia pseudosolanacearum]|uniref:hypothetical protein n=1 Tax=Ralstonia pseudosolanacearum TaxID=1310165 RepID=UPI003CF0E98C
MKFIKHCYHSTAICQNKTRQFSSIIITIQVENNIDNFDSAGVSFENYGILTLSDGAQTTYLAILPIAIPPSNLSYNHFIERRRLLGFDTEVQTKAIFAKKNGFNSMQQRANSAKQKHKKTNEDIAM